MLYYYIIDLKENYIFMFEVNIYFLFFYIYLGICLEVDGKNFIMYSCFNFLFGCLKDLFWNFEFYKCEK